MVIGLEFRRVWKLTRAVLERASVWGRLPHRLTLQVDAVLGQEALVPVEENIEMRLRGLAVPHSGQVTSASLSDILRRNSKHTPHSLHWNS